MKREWLRCNTCGWEAPMQGMAPQCPECPDERLHIISDVDGEVPKHFNLHALAETGRRDAANVE